MVIVLLLVATCVPCVVWTVPSLCTVMIFATAAWNVFGLTEMFVCAVMIVVHVHTH